MKEITILAAEQREEAGKGASRALRRDGKTPAIIYDAKHKDSRKIALNSKELMKEFGKTGFMSRIFELDFNGESKQKVIPSDIALHPVTDVIEHIDFTPVTGDTIVTVKVKIHLLNSEKAVGIKRGGVLNIVTRQLEVTCKPEEIPASIDIDVANLEIGHSIHSKNIELPKGVKLAGHKDITIATIVGRADDAAPKAE